MKPQNPESFVWNGSSYSHLWFCLFVRFCFRSFCVPTRELVIWWSRLWRELQTSAGARLADDEFGCWNHVVGEASGSAAETQSIRPLAAAPLSFSNMRAPPERPRSSKSSRQTAGCERRKQNGLKKFLFFHRMWGFQLSCKWYVV